MLRRLPAAVMELALFAPAGVVRGVTAAVGSAATAAAEIAAEAGAVGVRRVVNGAEVAAATAARVGRVARNVAPSGRLWRAGRRLHLPLQALPQAGARGATRVEVVAAKVARAVAEHPDVITAYWDGGLSRLVVQLAEDAATDRVVEKVNQLAASHGLVPRANRADEVAHPGDVSGVRTAAAALVLDAVGIAAAVTARAVPLKHSPPLVTAAATLLRDDPRVRDLLRGRLGKAGTELLLAAINAAAQGAAQSPTALVLDAALRVSQMTEVLARAAAFEAAHDDLCVPGRASLAGDRPAPRPVRDLPDEEYARNAVTASALAAAGTLVFKHDVQAAAEAVLAGSPKPARYGPAAFTAAVGSGLARDGVLVRDIERLRLLEIVDTVVLHASALRGSRRTVLRVQPHAQAVDHDRLWHGAVTAVQAESPGSRAALALRPLPDGHADDPGADVMIASEQGRDLGIVEVGWELDPLADAVLDAARHADLHVVVIADAAVGDFAALADEVVDATRPLEDVVRGLHGEGRVVCTVARALPDADVADRGLVAGLLASDLAVDLADEHSAIVWNADVLSLRGLHGLWRLLSAVPAAKAVGRRSKVLAEAGAALSGLLLVTGGQRRRMNPFALAVGLGPVNAAAAAALVSGWRAAIGVAARDSPRPRPRIPWHALEPGEVLSRVGQLRRAADVAPTALVRMNGRLRQGIGALSRLPFAGPAGLPVRLAGAVRTELNDPLTPVLAVGAAASAVLGSSVDALLVAGAMGMNAVVGAVQRVRAEDALAALAVGQQRTARVVRGRSGKISTVDAAQLAAGDVIELDVGDVIPADARLLQVTGLEVDESALTGESLPVTKQVHATPCATVGNRRCMVFEGTTVVAGQATAVVVGTGEQTESGRAVALAQGTPPAAGVQARLQELTRKALPWTLAGGAAVTGLSLLRGRSMREAVGGGVAVAVAAVPEGLPLVATVAQMAAARRLSRRGVLVRSPRALEALGRVNTVCFDKTGTLTENNLSVVRLVTAHGVEYQPDDPAGEAILRAAARACPRVGAATGGHAHATDEAVLDATPPDEEWAQLQGQPFEASRGYAAATGAAGGAAPILVVKGAPENVLPCCPNLGPEAASSAETLASEGLRVLAVAQRRLPDDEQDVLDKPLADLEFTGFVALADTPRPSATALVSDLRSAGVIPVMLTGDHPQTARAVAVALGWPKDTTVVTGDQIAALDRAGRSKVLRDAGVVARVAPEQKLQVVQALRAAGRVVAMIGDGANDAAAIRAADVGIGIAVRSSAAARNAADLVLTDDDISVLVDTVAEGRALWRSVADSISILIGGNAGEVGFTVAGTLLSGMPPLSTRQLLLVNLLTDMFPAMAVAVTPSDDSDAESVAGDTAPIGMAALQAPLARQIRQRGIITGLGAATAWTIGRLTPGTARRTSTMALCGVVGAQLTQTLIGRQHSRLILATAFGSAAVLVGIIQTPMVSHFFGCTPLGPVAWAGVGTAIGVAAAGPWLLPPIQRLVSHALPQVRIIH